MNFLIIYILLLIFPLKGVTKEQTFFNEKQYRIEKMKMNKTTSDIGPFFIDGVLYWSRLGAKDRSVEGGKAFYSIYKSTFYSALNNSQAIACSGLSTRYHDGPAVFCQSTNELFITRSEVEDALTSQGVLKTKKVRLRIDIYQFSNNEWVFKEEFPYNNPGYSVAHPAINTKGDTLIFISDMPGGEGGTDLYQSIRVNDEWQDPVNLGKTLNSRKNEITPYVDSKGRLFYASNGLTKRRDVDIFVTMADVGFYLPPRRLSAPFNTKYNDYGLIVASGDNVACFVSDRDRGVDNIYGVLSNDFNVQHFSTDSLSRMVKHQTELAQWQLTFDMQKMIEKGQLPNDIEFIVNSELIDTNRIADLKISYSYRVVSNRLKPGENIYRMNRYLPDDSNVAVALVNLLSEGFSIHWKRYMHNNKNVKISFWGNTDVLPISKSLEYKGEYGDKIVASCSSERDENGNPIDTDTLTINKGELITNKKLAFLRSYGLKRKMEQQIEALKVTKNDFCYYSVPTSKINENNDWVKIEFIIENACCNY